MKRSVRARSSRAGWTIIEVVLASVLMGTVMVKAAFLMKSALGLASDATASMHDEDHARRVMDRIALAIMGSNRDQLVPGVEEVHNKRLRYNFSLGLEDGEMVWSDPEEIRLADTGREVEWRENPDELEERKVVWTNLVRPLLEGEEINGVDDNENGLIDEDGLSFVIEGDIVTIRLTLERTEIGGQVVPQTIETVVNCRN
jgi:hypothetical protein